MGSGESQCDACALDLQKGVEVVHMADHKLGAHYLRSHCRANRLAGRQCGNMCLKQHHSHVGTMHFEDTDLLGTSIDLSALSPQERNAKLQDVVRAFVLRASAGVSCHIVDAITGCSWPASYTIDGRLQHLQVELNSRMHWSCRVAEVKRVIAWRDLVQGKEELFPITLRSAIPHESLRRLVMIEQRDGSRLCLLEEEACLAEELRVAVSILSLYSREQCSAKGAAPAPTGPVPMSAPVTNSCENANAESDNLLVIV